MEYPCAVDTYCPCLCFHLHHLNFSIELHNGKCCNSMWDFPSVLSLIVLVRIFTTCIHTVVLSILQQFSCDVFCGYNWLLLYKIWTFITAHSCRLEYRVDRRTQCLVFIIVCFDLTGCNSAECGIDWLLLDPAQPTSTSKI